MAIGAIGPPYEQTAPDGRSYFKVLPPEPSLVVAYENLLVARAELLKLPNALGRERGFAVTETFERTILGVDSAAATAASFADTTISQFIKAGQLRPDPPGKGGLTRLHQAIKSRPITYSGPLATGAVGIGDLDELRKVADKQGREYWRAQEFGSSHLIDYTHQNQVYGAFQPGGAPPNGADFRIHPIFQTGKGSRLIVNKPIPEKAFLRRGIAVAEKVRQGEFRQVAARGLREVQVIRAGLLPQVIALEVLESNRSRRR